MALSCIIFDKFDLEKYRNLQMQFRGHSTSLKLVPFNSLPIVSYQRPIVNTLLLRYLHNLKTWVRGHLGLL